MDEFIERAIIQWYEDLEERLIAYLKTTPYIHHNLGVRAPHLAGIITEACNILDSLFREVSPLTVTIKGKVKKQDDLTIVDFAELYAARYNLPATKSLMYVSPPQYVTPFKGWGPITTGGTYTPLPWWRAHTGLKHHRISEILNQATLSNAVEAVCALYQVITALPELGRAIVRYGWLRTGGINPNIIIEELVTQKRPRTVTCLVETALFVRPLGRLDISDFPDNLSDLEPYRYRGNERLTNFLAK